MRLESLESRTLLAADSLASIAGTVYVDLTDNGLTADDLRLPNATVQLYRDGGDGVLDRGAGGGDDTSVGSQLTDASGRYRFDDLVAGTYFAEQPTIAGRLRRVNTTVREVVITAQDAAGVLGTPIDSYDLTTQNVQASSIGPTSASSSIAAPESLGGERDLFVELTDGTGRIELLANSFAPGMLTYASDPAAVGRRLLPHIPVQHLLRGLWHLLHDRLPRASRRGERLHSGGNLHSGGWAGDGRHGDGGRKGHRPHRPARSCTRTDRHGAAGRKPSGPLFEEHAAGAAFTLSVPWAVPAVWRTLTGPGLLISFTHER